MFNDVMIDIETAGTTSNAAVLSVGAVQFDIATGEMKSTYEQNIELKNTKAHGDIDADTLIWWLKQSEEARAVFNGGMAINTFLDDFVSWFDSLTDENNEKVYANSINVYGNGSDFDCVIVSNLYKRHGRRAPWEFYRTRDVRTYVDIGRRLLGIDPKKDFPFEGARHNALADAIHQANYTSQIYQALATLRDGKK